MSTTTHVPALSPAAFAAFLCELPAETRGDYIATENGQPWARVSVGPYGSSNLSISPVGKVGERGDTRKRGQSGVVLPLAGGTVDRRSTAGLVIERARRMWRA